SVTTYYPGDDFMNRLLRELPLLRADAILPGTRAAMRAYNALGVTAVYEGHAMDSGLIEAYRMLRGEHARRLRVRTALEAELSPLPFDQPFSDAEFDARLEMASRMV